MRIGVARVVAVMLIVVVQGCTSFATRQAPDEEGGVPEASRSDTTVTGEAGETASETPADVRPVPVAEIDFDIDPDPDPDFDPDFGPDPDPEGETESLESDASPPADMAGAVVEDAPETEPEPVEAPAQAPSVSEREPSARPLPPADPVIEAPAPVVERLFDLSGRVELVGGDANPEEAVVYFVPERSDAVAQPQPAPDYEIVTRDKMLSPTVIAVPTGARVRFPNNDPILHNLFSVSADNAFDLGVYGPGDAPSVTFDQTGVVNIYCNVHHDMHAHVLVIDSPWQTQPGRDGQFLLEGLPAGAGELHIWHRQSERWSQALELPAAGPLRVSLEVTKPKLPPHRDKAGQPYNRRGRDPYR